MSFLPAHGEQPRRVVGDVHAVDVELERHWPHVGVKVEGGVGAAAEPAGQVLGIGHGRAQGNDPHLLLQLGGDVPEVMQYRYIK